MGKKSRKQGDQRAKAAKQKEKGERKQGGSSRGVENQIPTVKQDGVAIKHCCFKVLFIGAAGTGKTKVLTKMLRSQSVNNADRQLSRHSEYCETSEAGQLEGNEMYCFHIDTETTKFHIMELPSSFKFKPGMLRSAAKADIAVLFVSGVKGEFEGKELVLQTKQWLCLAVVLSIPTIVLVVNKIDTSYSEERF